MSEQERFEQPRGVTWLDHTADAGFAVQGSTPPQIYERSVAALRWLLLGPEPVRSLEERQICLEGEDRAELLVALLEEVLFLLEVDHFVTAGARVELEVPGRLTVRLHGEPHDPERHRLEREVKAITYHNLSFERTAGGYRATVLVDL